MTGPIDPRRLTTVYRLYDAKGRLLYVGTSVEPQERWEQHSREKLWWSSVARATVDWFSSRTEALAAEREAIRSEYPLHNEKASEEERVFPFQGNQGPNQKTMLRRAATQHRKVLDKLAVAVERAARSGLTVEQISDALGVSEDEVRALAARLMDGGGNSGVGVEPIPVSEYRGTGNNWQYGPAR